MQIVERYAKFIHSESQKIRKEPQREQKSAFASACELPVKQKPGASDPEAYESIRNICVSLCSLAFACVSVLFRLRLRLLSPACACLRSLLLLRFLLIACVCLRFCDYQRNPCVCLRFCDPLQFLAFACDLLRNYVKTATARAISPLLTSPLLFTITPSPATYCHRTDTSKKRPLALHRRPLSCCYLYYFRRILPEQFTMSINPVFFEA